MSTYSSASVTEYARECLSRRSIDFDRVPTGPGAISFLDRGITGFTLHRDGPFQMQLFIVPPLTKIPEHTHPGVEVVEIYVTGQFLAEKSGVPVVTLEQMLPDEHGNCPLSWKKIPLALGEKHSAVTGPDGCVFLSAQKWLDGKPKPLHLDWAGESLGEAHTEELREDKP